MKTKKNTWSAIISPVLPMIAMIALALNSCSIDENINNSPNAANENSIKTPTGLYAVLIGMQIAAGDFYSGDRSRVSSIWTNQMYAPEGLGRPQPVAWNNYKQTEDGPPQDMWTLGYRAVKLANDVIDFSPGVFTGANQNINPAMQGIAYAYKALMLGELAAYYGSIPIETHGLTPPKFVPQDQAYAEVQRLLDSALISFGNNPGSVAQDLNFQGDATKWIPVIHSLKARYYLHIKQYDKASSEATQGIKDPADNLYAIYTNTPGEYSPWGHWTLTEAGEPIRVEATFMRALKSDSGDKRIAEYFKPNDQGQYWGYAGRGEPNPDSSEIDPTKVAHLRKYGGYGDPFPLITYQETVLILAECNARSGNIANALSNLNIIRSAAGLADFNSTNPDAVITEILRQKWLQLFLEGQAYTDMRRTNTLPDPAVPKRWIYPQTELNANPNVPAQSDDLVKYILP